MIRERLQVAIQYSNKDIKQIARESGIHETTIYKILNNSKKNVKTDTIKILCRTLNVSSDWMLGLSEEMERKK